MVFEVCAAVGREREGLVGDGTFAYIEKTLQKKEGSVKIFFTVLQFAANFLLLAWLCFLAYKFGNVRGQSSMYARCRLEFIRDISYAASEDFGKLISDDSDVRNNANAEFVNNILKSQVYRIEGEGGIDSFMKSPGGGGYRTRKAYEQLKEVSNELDNAQ